MTKEEVILQKKATALNAIRKLYHPLSEPIDYCWQEGETSASRRDEEVLRVIRQLEKDLIKLKHTTIKSNKNGIFSNSQQINY
jgi:hypothetical protein